MRVLYTHFGDVKISLGVPISTMWPKCMTPTVSQRSDTVNRGDEHHGHIVFFF